MDFGKKLSVWIFSGVFLTIIAFLGVFSLIGLVNYYVNDETDYNSWSPELGNKFETDVASNFCRKPGFVDLNGGVRRLLGQREMNGVVKLDNGYLMTTFDRVSDEELQKNADAVIALKEYLEEKGIAFLYAIPPYTSCKYDPQLPEGIEDFGNDNLDRFAGMLRQGGVDPMDFREIMHEDGIDQYDMMYRTDHHWTTQAGFYVYTKMTECLEDMLECQVDERVKDFSNYTVTTWRKWHLGSRGQRTGAWFTGVDDFDLILPGFETMLIRERVEGIPGMEEEMAGDFESLVIDREALQNRSRTSRYTYDSVLGKANFGYANENARNDKQLLVITDSFGKAVNPYLILSYGGMHCVDSEDELDVNAYLEQYEPDAVVMYFYAENVFGHGRYRFKME